MRIDDGIEPAVIGIMDDWRVARGSRIDVGLELGELRAVDPLGGIAPVLQARDAGTLRLDLGGLHPFDAAAAVPPRRAPEFVGECAMRLHAGDVEIVIRFRRLVVGVGPGEADARRAAADARRFQHRDGCARLRQPERDRGAHHPGADHHDLCHSLFS